LLLLSELFMNDIKIVTDQQAKWIFMNDIKIVTDQQAKDVHNYKNNKRSYIKLSPPFNLTKFAEQSTSHRTMFMSRWMEQVTSALKP